MNRAQGKCRKCEGFSAEPTAAEAEQNLLALISKNSSYGVSPHWDPSPGGNQAHFSNIKALCLPWASETSSGPFLTGEPKQQNCQEHLGTDKLIQA